MVLKLADQVVQLIRKVNWDKCSLTEWSSLKDQFVHVGCSLFKCLCFEDKLHFCYVSIDRSTLTKKEQGRQGNR